MFSPKKQITITKKVTMWGNGCVNLIGVQNVYVY